MANDLVVFEEQLKHQLPMLQQVLMDRMPVERLARTIIVSCEKTPKLLQCNRQSLFSSAMTAAVLGLEVDGMTGQAYLVPFNDKNRGQIAQLLIGYQGYNTLGARSGYSITAGVVREKDAFEFDLGSSPFIRHKPSLSEPGSRIIAAWACATSKTMPPIPVVLPLADIEAVRSRSKAAGSQGGFSPWDDPNIGRPAMYEKTGRRRLRRSMPLNANTREYLLAARLDEAIEEQGLPGAIGRDGTLMIDGKVEQPDSPFPQGQSDAATPSASDLIGPKDDLEKAHAKRELLEAAEGGTAVVGALWSRLQKERPALARDLVDFKDKEVKPIAERADRG